MKKKMRVKNLSQKVIIVLGCIIRFLYGMQASPKINQHDVIGNYGCHFDYAVNFYKSFSLPNSNVYEFCQGPLNAIIQGLFMRITSFRNKNLLKIYTNCKLLSILYSIFALVLVYMILKEFDLKNKTNCIILFIMSFYPGLILQASQYSNDPLSYMFFILSLYLAIVWCRSCAVLSEDKSKSKNRPVLIIILLALSISLGMLTKISVGLIAFLIGPMMFIIWIKSLKNDKYKFKEITIQLIIFSLIVFPLGLSFYIRNKLVFNQPFGYVYEIAKNTKYEIDIEKYGILERFLSLPINRIFNDKYFVYHDPCEYNVWVDLLKTSVFDELKLNKIITTLGLFDVINVIILLLNCVFFILGIISIIFNFIGIFRNKSISHIDLNNIGIILFVLSVLAYICFNFKYQYSCNSNYRYIPYITLSLALSIGVFMDQKKLEKSY